MLEELLRQRTALLDNPGLPLFLLRQHDRRLALWCERHPKDLVSGIWGTIQAETQKAWLAELRLELVTRQGHGNGPESGTQPRGTGDELVAHWRLAAHFSHVAMPTEEPEHSELQLWVAMAMARRGLDSRLSPVWLAWIDAQESDGPGSEQGLRRLLAGLWDCNREHWRHWFYPLMLRLPEIQHPAMINWLAGQVDNPDLVEAMGVSGADRFKPWLDELAGRDDELGVLARDARHQPAGNRRDILVRARYWWPRWRQLEGSPWSLFGGCWQ